MMTSEEKKEKARTKSRDWYERNKEYVAQRQRELFSGPRRVELLEVKRHYYHAHRAETSAAQRAFRDSHPQETWTAAVRQSARLRAKDKGLPYDRSLVIETPDVCPVLGLVLDYGRKGDGRHHDNSPTLDRLIPELGYVAGNVVTISHRANRIKNDGTAEEHERIAQFIKEMCRGCS